MLLQEGYCGRVWHPFISTYSLICLTTKYHSMNLHWNDDISFICASQSPLGCKLLSQFSFFLFSLHQNLISVFSHYHRIKKNCIFSFSVIVLPLFQFFSLFLKFQIINFLTLFPSFVRRFHIFSNYFLLLIFFFPVYSISYYLLSRWCSICTRQGLPCTDCWS